MRQSYIVSYYCMLIRDMSILAITCFMLWKVSRASNTNSALTQITDGSRETHIQLYDFTSVLLSVLPYQFFRQYITKQRTSLLPYLKVLTLYYKYKELLKSRDEALRKEQLEGGFVVMKHLSRSDEQSNEIEFLERRILDIYREQVGLLFPSFINQSTKGNRVQFNTEVSVVSSEQSVGTLDVHSVAWIAFEQLDKIYKSEFA